MGGTSEAPNKQIIQSPIEVAGAQATKSHTSTAHIGPPAARPPEAMIAHAPKAPAQISTARTEPHEPTLRIGPCGTTKASRIAERSDVFDLGILVTCLEEESRSEPDARLVVTCPPAISLVFDKDSAVTPLQPILGGYVAFAIAQGYEKPMFWFRLPYRQLAPEATSPFDELNCQIIYNPTNDICTLVHSVALKFGAEILLTNMDDPPARISVPRGQPCVLKKVQRPHMARSGLGGPETTSSRNHQRPREVTQAAKNHAPPSTDQH
ncbi:hypothetical protein HDV57DRAFT_494116 [Trichoderma longibrachiatum]